MKQDKVFFFMVLGVYFVFVAGCSGVQVVPKNLEEQVNRDISFVQLIEAPLEHKGQILVIGGQVLSAKRLKHATQIEVLQLPLNRNMKPEDSLQESQGRFLSSGRIFRSCDSAFRCQSDGGRRSLRDGDLTFG